MRTIWLTATLLFGAIAPPTAARSSGPSDPPGRAPSWSPGTFTRSPDGRSLAFAVGPTEGDVHRILVEPVPAGNEGALVLAGGTVRVAPEAAPIEDGVVVIEGGVIAAVGGRDEVAVPEGLPVLDCSGLTVTAGFWNCHVHFFERKWSGAADLPGPELERQLEESFTRHGFTSVFDAGSPWENTRAIRRRVASGEVAGPRIRSTGEPLLAPHAMPPASVLGLLGLASFPTPEVTDADGATVAAGELLARGVDGIDRPVFVHPASGADVRAAIRAGVDVVAHTTPGSGPWDASLLAGVGEAGVALTPTLSLWGHFARHDRLSVREAREDAAVAQLAAWRAAGGTVIFGTDAGANDFDPTDEYVLMAAAGMDLSDILAALTTAPAGRFGGDEGGGRLAVGQPADLVVWGSDAAGDPRALADVRYTLRDGRVVHRAGP